MKVETNNIIGNVGLTSEVIYATQLMCNCFIGALSCFFQPTKTRVLQNNSYVHINFIFLKKIQDKSLRCLQKEEILWKRIFQGNLFLSNV